MGGPGTEQLVQGVQARQVHAELDAGVALRLALGRRLRVVGLLQGRRDACDLRADGAKQLHELPALGNQVLGNPAFAETVDGQIGGYSGGS